MKKVLGSMLAGLLMGPIASNATAIYSFVSPNYAVATSPYTTEMVYRFSCM
jgi:hypothetical protein